MIGTAIATLGVTALVYYLERREKLQKRIIRDFEEHTAEKDHRRIDEKLGEKDVYEG